MQRLFILSVIFLLTVSAANCSKEKKDSKVYKGRLEIEAICMNYTVKLLEGNIDTAKIVSNWTDASTNKSYTNVFALEDPCSLPGTIKQGDEFYFVIDTVTPEPCIVCLAYYPTPPKKLLIKIIKQ